MPFGVNPNGQKFQAPPTSAQQTQTENWFFVQKSALEFSTRSAEISERRLAARFAVRSGASLRATLAASTSTILWLTMVSKFVGTPVTNVLSRLASTSKINTLSLATCPALSHSLSHTHSLSQNWTENSLASTLSLFLWTYRTHTHTAYFSILFIILFIVTLSVI